MEAEARIWPDYDDSYILFERAIVARDEGAWAALYARYHCLLTTWVRHCAAFAHIHESCEDLADQAFARAWMALSPAQFRRFPTISSLLGYLRCCATTVVPEYVRAQLVRERATERFGLSTTLTQEEHMLDQIDRMALWKLCWRMTTSEPERVVLYEVFGLALPPREVLARHTDLFADVTDVYVTKRRLIERLRRNPDLRAMCEVPLS